MLGWCEDHIKPLLAELPRNGLGFVGGDFGRTGDLSAFLPLLQRQDLTRYVPFIIELRGMPFRQQLQLPLYLMDGLPTCVGAALDGRGLGAKMGGEADQREGPARDL